MGEEIRRLLKFTPPGLAILPETELLLFAASRAQLVREIHRPGVGGGTDRDVRPFPGFDDRLPGRRAAAEPGGRGGHQPVRRRAARPDLTFLLDLPTDAALERLRLRTRWTNLPLDRMELRTARVLRTGPAGLPDAGRPRTRSGLWWSTPPGPPTTSNAFHLATPSPTVFHGLRPARSPLITCAARTRADRLGARVPDRRRGGGVRAGARPRGGRRAHGPVGGAGATRTFTWSSRNRNRGASSSNRSGNWNIRSVCGRRWTGAQGGHPARGRPAPAAGGQRVSQDAGGATGGVAAAVGQRAAREHDGDDPLALHQGHAAQAPAGRGRACPARGEAALRELLDRHAREQQNTAEPASVPAAYRLLREFTRTAGHRPRPAPGRGRRRPRTRGKTLRPDHRR